MPATSTQFFADPTADDPIDFRTFCWTPPKITVAQHLLGAAAIRPSLGGHSLSSICRKAGSRGCVVGRRRLILPSVRIGARRYFTREGVDWYLQACQAAELEARAMQDHAGYRPMGPHREDETIAQVEQEAKALGI